MTPDEILQAIREQAPGIARQIRAAADAHPGNEADFRRPVERIIEDFAEVVGLHHDPHHEYTLLNGRADSVYNRLVIEYEPPTSIRQSNTYGSNKHAIEQVKGYIDGLSRRERHKKERIAGVVLDGHWFIFIRHKDERWEIDEPMPVATESTERFLRYLNSLSTELAVTPENLIRDFGENTRISRPCVNRLYQAIVGTNHPRVSVLFEQWSLQFSEICGYEPGSSKLDVKELADRYGVKGKGIQPLQLFFAIHTYYATFIKLLAVQIASFYAMPKLGTRLQQVANYDSPKLRDYLAKMERGGVFKDFGIGNFLEGDFFGWYLDVWDDEMDDGVRRVLSQLAGYSLVTLDVDPDNTRDLLKRLYQNLMPKALRHDLGEYYTPDWLAERLLNQLGYTQKVKDLPRKRLLDPACGSGTFLVLAIKRIRQWAAAQDSPVAEADLLDRILANVVGFDLNPLAVISARTNYLLALGDLLQYRRGDINIPVYLADSILTPDVATETTGQLVMGETHEPTLSFPTAVGRFSVPQTLVSAQYIDHLADLLEECVAAHYSDEEFRRRLLVAFPVTEQADGAAIAVACGLFHRLSELEAQGINGIWARIIKNAFAPLFCGRFDYVAGNPPWINWESLPDSYRREVIHLNQHVYGLFMVRGLRAKSGAAEMDISALMTYVAADRYLLETGRLGFVITQALFQSTGGEGFRQFHIRGGGPLKVLGVDDMVEVHPFEGAANRTAVVVLAKGAKTNYPVPYTVWRRRGSARIRETDGLAEVSAVTTRTHNWAAPILPDDTLSSWATGAKAIVNLVRRSGGASGYVAHKGIDTGGASGVYWVHLVGVRPDGQAVVANLADAGRSETTSAQGPVEDSLVYRLVRGRDVHRWGYDPSCWMVIPQDPSDPKHAIREDALKASYPAAWRYLSQFQDQLSARKTYRTFLEPVGEPFYALYSVKQYTFAPYKVVWREIATQMTMAVVSTHDGRPDIPEHKLVLVAFDDPTEAHYVCALLASSVVGAITSAYCLSTSYAPHILRHVALPPYAAREPVHRRMSGLSQQAHQAVASGAIDSVASIEAEIDELAAQLWGLTDKELKDIQDSLADLRA